MLLLIENLDIMKLMSHHLHNLQCMKELEKVKLYLKNIMNNILEKKIMKKLDKKYFNI